MKKKRINLLLMGGLGNQLFQYAAGSNLARNYSAQLVLDYRFLKFFGVEHRITLTDFSFKEPVLVRSDNGNFKLFKKTIARLLGLIRRFSFLSKICKTYFGIYLTSNIDEPLTTLETYPPKLILGYFQTKQHIESVRDSIELPVFPRISSYLFSDYYELMTNNEFVAIHVRLGDYEAETETIGNLSENYYLRALDYFESIYPTATYLIFTNDAESLAINFPVLLSKQHVQLFEPKAKLSDFEIFSLMSACSGHIIANSTFSYWSAALSMNSKMVIRPSKWFKKLIEPQDLFPDHWLEADSDWL